MSTSVPPDGNNSGPPDMPPPMTPPPPMSRSDAPVSAESPKDLPSGMPPTGSPTSAEGVGTDAIITMPPTMVLPPESSEGTTLPPPTGPPTPSASQTTNPELEAAEDEAAVSNRKQLTAFKYATAILAVLSILLFIFTVYLNAQYNSLRDQTRGEIDSLTQQVQALQVAAGGVLATEAQEIGVLQDEVQRLQSQLEGTEKDLAKQSAALSGAQKDYQQLEKQAQKRQASNNDKLKAAEAEAELASRCATVAYSGLIAIYESFDVETIREVAAILRESSASCEQIIG